MMSMVTPFEYLIFIIGGAIALIYGIASVILGFFEKK